MYYLYNPIRISFTKNNIYNPYIYQFGGFYLKGGSTLKINKEPDKMQKIRNIFSFLEKNLIDIIVLGSRSPFESKSPTSSSDYDIILVLKNTPDFNYNLFFPNNQNKNSLMQYKVIFDKGKEIMEILGADIDIIPIFIKDNNVIIALSDSDVRFLEDVITRGYSIFESEKKGKSQLTTTFTDIQYVIKVGVFKFKFSSKDIENIILSKYKQTKNQVKLTLGLLNYMKVKAEFM